MENNQPIIVRAIVNNGVLKVKTENEFGSEPVYFPKFRNYKDSHHIHTFTRKHDKWKKGEAARKVFDVDPEEYRVEEWSQSRKISLFPSGKHIEPWQKLSVVIRNNLATDLQIIT